LSLDLPLEKAAIEPKKAVVEAKIKILIKCWILPLFY
jgi:hypothetical protein